MQDFYKSLGLARNATAVEIKKAFRKLARQYHPDVNPDPVAEERFIEILQAYETLGDSEKRRMYDRSGAERAFPGTGMFDIGDFSHIDELEDLLAGEAIEKFFSRKGKYGPRKGGDLRFDIELTLEDAFLGATREVMAPRTENCHFCEGSGVATGSSVKSCSVCNGLGQVKGVAARGASRFVTIDSCPHCRGSGKVAKDQCDACSGRGRIRNLKAVRVMVPPGVHDGAELRLPDEGTEGFRGGPRGDIYLLIRVRPHPVFSRDGYDLRCEKKISYPVAVLGGTMRIDTIDGKADLGVPAGTQTGTVLRLRGQGMPLPAGGCRGDLLVTVVVHTPERLTAKQRKILRELEAPETGNEKHGGWWW